MGPWSWHMMPFRVDFGARCAFSGSVLVCGAPFLVYRKDQAMHSGQLFTLTTTVYEFSLRMHPNRCRKCRKIMMDKWCMSIMIRKQF